MMHNYTIQLTISADGRLLSLLFIVLEEVTGIFDPKVQEGIFKAPYFYYGFQIR